VTSAVASAFSAPLPALRSTTTVSVDAMERMGDRLSGGLPSRGTAAARHGGRWLSASRHSPAPATLFSRRHGDRRSSGAPDHAAPDPTRSHGPAG
jgi:hypothetical protein